MPRNNIELRSEEVQEILGQMPNWIIRRGTVLMFSVILVLLLGSWVFRYPDIIPSKAVLTTENPPAKLVAKVNGKINRLLVEENGEVSSGQVLAMLETPSRLEDIDALRSQLNELQIYFADFLFPEELELEKSYRLGELQGDYTEFLRQYSDYRNFLKLQYYARKIESKKDQVKKYNIYYNRLYQQRNILEKELSITKQQFQRDSLLCRKGVLAPADVQKSQKAYLEQSYAFHGARTSLANTTINISSLQQEIMDLELKHEEELKSKQNALLQSYENLKAQLDIWEQNYLLKAPVAGRVSFNKYWTHNQNVTVGERVLTVIPKDSTRIVARIELGLLGAGKVKVGQSVNIKLDNYPYMEYGMLKGVIETISMVPDDQKYSCEVKLTNGLTTNYGRSLSFSQQMEGSAEIITEDIRLLQRIFNPIRALFLEHI